MVFRFFVPLCPDINYYFLKYKQIKRREFKISSKISSMRLSDATVVGKPDEFLACSCRKGSNMFP